jgi:hypothetical protein
MIRRALCVIGILALLASPAFAKGGKGAGHSSSGKGSHSHSSSKSGSTHSSSSTHSSRKSQEVVVARTPDGKIARSETARRDFMKQTGYPNGRPGYVVDHVKPLACGGLDAPSNMQWQTVAEAKAKDKTERIGCH